MHQLTEIELNFSCHTMATAQWFNDSAEQLWQHELLPVAQQVLDEFDVAAEVKLDEICLQLPPMCLPGDRYLLQHSFRQALRTQLWLLLPQATTAATRQQQQLTSTERNNLISALKSADSAALTLHWPLYRRFASELVALLRQLAASGDICTVLAFGLNTDMLAELVQLLVPTEQRFVLQLLAQPQLFAVTPARLSHAVRQQAQLPPPALRQRQRHLWQLSLSYLLVERGSRFNRQSYLHYLLQRMAAHDNVSLQALVQHMLLTLEHSQRYFATHSPLLLQLTQLLQPLLTLPQPGEVNTAVAAGLAYGSQRRALSTAVLPAVKRYHRPQAALPHKLAQLNPAERWQRWQYLLRQARLTLAQQRQFNGLLLQLLQQNSSLWLDQLRQQMQQLSLLPSLVQYAQPELLQRLFQQLQPASVAALTPYIRLLHWALTAINLPLPLQQQARWQPLLQCALQPQPLTLSLLLVQLQLWLQAQQGAVAGRHTLQQLAGQLQYYSGNIANAADSQSARLWQQLQWQLAVTAPWATTPVPARLAAAAAVGNTVAAGPLWQQLVQLVVQALPATIQARAQLLCQHVVAQFVPSSLLPVTPATQQPASTMAIAAQSAVNRQPAASVLTPQPETMPDSTAVLLGSALLSTLMSALAPASSSAFYRNVQSKLQQATPGRASSLLLGQLQRLLQYLAPERLPHQPGSTANGCGLYPPVSTAPLPQPPGTEPAKVQQGKATPARLADAKTAQYQTPHSQVAQTAKRQPARRDGDLAAQRQPAESMQLVSNAGLVLAAPYLPLLWQRLGWVAAQRFNSEQHAWQACALLHYMATGETAELIRADYWQQWRLGMLLTGRQPPGPVDIDIRLSDTQLELADSLLAGILAQWPKLANSSVETLRQCFLQRGGSLVRLGNGSGWQLQLDSGPYDMLLEGLPWSFSLICYPWMQGELYVHWRG
ncbi:hypothetical protein WG68_17250 [Arsukibacterium ikkense]|uniref:Uncharacterized protein n=1 Tax=Arsukibacterium ikkense TaxID=336831 RepID=A0A0M2UZU0_9GAMM|nr:contractile injection system tape measure protein [Arsukibacterium ikkense]KKO44067.1 hypothetical protein WG68_17250 [Arsukibacterium ikkense]